jgi:hypothetical protein
MERGRRKASTSAKRGVGVSIWHCEFTARFAPVSEWHPVDELEERFSATAFRNQGLTKRPETTRIIPVVLRHDDKQVVGKVDAVWVADGWWCARFKLSAALNLAAVIADYLDVGTPVLPSFIPVEWRDFAAARQYERAWLTELSIVRPPSRPAYRGAEVTYIVGRDLPLSLSRPRSPRAVEHRNPPGHLLRRPNSGYVIGVR